LRFGLIASLKTILKNDQRRARRRECDLDARIRPVGSFKTQKCRVLDISELGVRLTADDARTIPDRFLFFSDKGGVGREAHVKWRRSTQMGAELRTAAMASQVDQVTRKIDGSLLLGAAVAAMLLILMYELAGLWGATTAVGVILIFVGLRTDSGTRASPNTGIQSN
jgi:hypothetical protein